MVSYETELLDACEFGDVESVSNMIANGADPKKQYLDKGETALHWAARYHSPHKNFNYYVIGL